MSTNQTLLGGMIWLSGLLASYSGGLMHRPGTAKAGDVNSTRSVGVQPARFDSAETVSVSQESQPQPTEFAWLLAQQWTVEAMARLKGAIAAMDFQEAADWIDAIQTLPRSVNNDRAVHLLWARLTELDAPAAHAKALAITAPRQRQVARSAVAAAWSEQDPMGLIQWGRLHASDTMRHYYTLGIARLGEQGRVDLMLEMFDNLPPDQRRSLVGSIGSVLAQQSPERLSDWMDGLGDEILQTHVLQRLAWEFGQTNPSEALEWLSSLALDPADRPEWAERTIITRWLQQGGSDEALAWARGQGNSTITDTILSRTATLLVKHDPGRAVSLVREISKAETVVETANEILSQALPADELRPWIDILPPGPERTRTVGRLISRMAERDRAEAEDFLNSISDLTERERAQLKRRIPPAGPRPTP